eukprot:CAMPEP_0198419184 /NCGR_PEP_ID=MMETSP1452-20131203/35_1 /TAXON_ID=1181717 /ORGANISM="Synchroma pusillum, Strain CCMP3072" /LENGTH=95 /DNA_ID=CAMNT_0044139307 /DNA_START=36 /DNA_END=323 /DNA_ORIENTATION=-
MSEATPVEGPKPPRVIWTKPAEEKLRQQMAGHARDMCKEFIDAFGHCAKRNHIMYVFNCRGESREMNSCLDQYVTEDKIQKRKQQLAKALAPNAG